MYNKLDPLLHSELRLAIVSLLIHMGKAEFVYIREKTKATAGNLSVQIEKLFVAGYISVKKSFRGKKPLTECKITRKGIASFEKYVNDLKTYIEPDQ